MRSDRQSIELETMSFPVPYIPGATPIIARLSGCDRNDIDFAVAMTTVQDCMADQPHETMRA
jgi:hypothetical protein